jgi:hypothetical protein
MAELDVKEIADAQFKVNEDLYARMDDDAVLVNLIKENSRIRDVNNKNIPNTLYIVLNDAAMFAWRVESALNAAIEQVSVTSENKGFDTDYIEDFIKYAFKEVDRILPLKDLYPLNPFLDQQTTRRGHVAARCTCRLTNDNVFVPDIVPYDSRYFTRWLADGSLGGTSYKIKRPKNLVQNEYPDVKLKDDDTDIEIEDIWIPKYDYVYVNGEKSKTEPNIYNEVPVVYRRVPMGSMLLDEYSQEYHGESIFFLIRDLLPELNRLASILQTLNLRQLDNALQLKMPAANIDPSMNVPDHDTITNPGNVTVVPSEGGFEYMPIGQIKQEAQFLHDMIQVRIDSATLNKLQTLVQPKTATEILQVVQDQSDLIMPRLSTRGLIKQDLATMMIKQLLMLTKKKNVKSVSIGAREFEVEKLKGDYTIEYMYYFNDPKLDMARTSMAISQKGLISGHTIRRDTLQLQDPEGEEDLMRWEEAEIESPLIRKKRRVMSLIEQDKDGKPGAETDAKLELIELFRDIDITMSGGNAVQPNKTNEKQMPTNVSVGDLPGGLI